MGWPKAAAAAPAVMIPTTMPGSIDISSMNDIAWIWLFSLFLAHVLLTSVLRKVGPFKAEPAVMAHQVCALACILWTGVGGLYYWSNEAPGTTNRLYGRLEGGPVVTKVNFAFQVYDFFTTAMIPELYKTEMMVHHAVAATLGYLLLRDGFSHYYAIFFLGVSEFSSIPLVFVDVLKHFPDVAKQCGPLPTTALRMAFALLFLAIRVVYWPIVSMQFWTDTLAAYRAGTLHSYGVAAFFCVCNIGLTILQLFWGFLIIRAIVRLARGGKGGGDKGGSNGKGDGGPAGGDSKKQN